MKKIYVLLGAVMLSGLSWAQQNYQYEFSATQKHTPGAISTYDNRDAVSHNQDRASYYFEDFDAMSDLNTTWIAAVQNGGVGFELTNTGHANDAGSSFFIPALLSSTPTQWILLDSDSDGSSGVDEDATLTSPTIDLTANGYTTGPLKLEFEQFFAEWEQAPNYDTLYVGISDDGGATWDEVQISNGVGREGRPNPELVTLNITSWVVDPTQVQIRFRWDGNWGYGWQIDNVEILDLPDNDLYVLDVFRGDLINSVMYSRIPEEQTVPFVLGCNMKNIGFMDQTNVGFDYEIFDGSMNSIGTGTATSTTNLAAGENDTIWVTTSVTPTTQGNYTIHFTANADQTEDPADTSNNHMVDQHFWLTDYEYGVDYGTPQSAFYNWANNSNGIATIGNIFLIQVDGVIGGMRAELDDNSNVVGNLMYYSVYLWDGAQYNWVAQTGDYTISASDEGNWVDLYFSSPINVTAGDQIFASAGHYGGDPSAGWEMAGRVPQGTVLGTDASAQFVNLIDPSAPAVRLLMTDFTSVEDADIENNFSIYPNPANENINISVISATGERTTINLVDITGKVITSYDLGILKGEKNMSIKVEDLSTGIYFIELVNESGRQVKKFVKK